MISDKMKIMLNNNSAIRTMFEEGKKMAAIYGADKVYDFSLGNPSVPPSEKIKDAIIDILYTQSPLEIHGYTSNAGKIEVRKAVANFLNDRYDTSYDEDDIIMTVGAASAINILLRSIINPDDKILTFRPYFGEYASYASNYDAIFDTVATDDNFMPDIDDLRAKIDDKTKAIIINSPNNPTGVIYDIDTIQKISKVISDKEKEYDHTIILISDEPYRELAYDDIDVAWIPDIVEHSVVIYSYSKSMSLPGERIGWLLIPKSIPEHDMLYQASVIANRISGNVNAPSLMQEVIARCIGMMSDISIYDNNRKILYRHLTKLGFSCIYPQGAFYLFIKAPYADEDKLIDIAKKHHILIVGGSFFGEPGYARVSYCISEETLRNSLPAWTKVAHEMNI